MRILIAILLISACSPFPELEETIGAAARDAPYPDLTPLPALPQAGQDESARITQRVAALQARAARLRQIDIGALQ